jgi:hypothetical protein
MTPRHPFPHAWRGVRRDFLGHALDADVYRLHEGPDLVLIVKATDYVARGAGRLRKDADEGDVTSTIALALLALAPAPAEEG